MDGTGGILLRRRGLVAPRQLVGGPLPPPAGKLPRRPGTARADVPSGVVALEAELLQFGFLVSGGLRGALAELSADELTRVGRRLLHLVRAELGASVEHVPLFRHFPKSVPADTTDFYVKRTLTLLAQRPEQPCVLCGETSGGARGVALRPSGLPGVLGRVRLRGLPDLPPPDRPGRPVPATRRAAPAAQGRGRDRLAAAAVPGPP